MIWEYCCNVWSMYTQYITLYIQNMDGLSLFEGWTFPLNQTPAGLFVLPSYIQTAADLWTNANWN
jgi:hypothetical protein